MGTLSKAVGAYGGYLCASRAVIDLMQTRARTFIYSTGLPPPVVAAAIASLDVIAREPAYAALPLRKAKEFARALNLPEAQSAIVPGDRRRGRRGAGGIRPVARRRISGGRDPAADGAGWHRAAAFCLHGAAPRCRDRAARRRGAKPRAKALTRERDLHHRDGHRRRQDLRGGVVDPAPAPDGPLGRRHQAGGQRLRSGAGTRPAIRACFWRRSACR